MPKTREITDVSLAVIAVAVMALDEVLNECARTLPSTRLQKYRRVVDRAWDAILETDKSRSRTEGSYTTAQGTVGDGCAVCNPERAREIEAERADARIAFYTDAELG